MVRKWSKAVIPLWVKVSQEGCDSRRSSEMQISYLIELYPLFFPVTGQEYGSGEGKFWKPSKPLIYYFKREPVNWSLGILTLRTWKDAVIFIQCQTFKHTC